MFISDSCIRPAHAANTRNVSAFSTVQKVKIGLAIPFQKVGLGMKCHRLASDFSVHVKAWPIEIWGTACYFITD